MSTPWTPDRFEDLFRATAPRVRTYLHRHVEPDVVDDLLAETFTVAWTRLDRVPAEPLPWLFVVARNTVRRQWRSRRRADELFLRSAREHWTHIESPPDAAMLKREDALQALSECSALEREALLLTAWDGLSATEAAAVAGCSPRAFTVRLSRARSRFDRALGSDPPAPEAPLAPTATLVLAPMEQS